MPVPFVGGPVHYVESDDDAPCRAAVVTEVGQRIDSGREVGLCVFMPTHPFFIQAVEQDDSDAPAARTWHWLRATCLKLEE